MTSTADVRHVTRLLPDTDHPFGPITRMLYRRLTIGFGAAWIAALALIAFAPAGFKAFGLGLLFPGAGFLYAEHVVWAVISLAAVVVTLLLWVVLSTETIILPVWLATAVVAGFTTGENTWNPTLWIVPVTVALALVVRFIGIRVVFARRRKIRARLNTRLAAVSFPITGSARHDVTESSVEDLAALRHPLDLLLQPIDSYEGFSKIDQFREGALRYQLNWGQFALATAQFTRTPAFTGYLAEAQRNAIEKVLQPVNWRYWRWENLWGNGEWNPDPIRRMNIMLPGFYGVTVGLYQSVTGDDRYNQPGALTFREGHRRAYAYDYDSISRCVVRDVDDSILKLQPCEPSWVYSICNTFTLNSLALHHRLNDDADAAMALERVLGTYEREFLRPDGHFITFRAKRGPAYPVPHNWSDAMIAALGNAMMPEVARRTWWLLRDRMGDPSAMKPNWMDRIDLGNYRFGPDTAMRIAIIGAAREMGDAEVAAAFEAYLAANEEINTEAGAPHFRRASVLANLMWVHARFMRENSWRDMVAFDVPREWHTGPVLAEAAYPAVQVARAVTDGAALDLVLRPGDGGGRTRLGLSRLVAGREYAVTGALSPTLVAGADGTATVEVDLADRLELRVRPFS